MIFFPRGINSHTGTINILKIERHTDTRIRWYRDEKIFQLERRAIFSKVQRRYILTKISLNPANFETVLAHCVLHSAIPEPRGLLDA